MSVTINAATVNAATAIGLDLVRQQCDSCRKCPHGSTRKQVVFSKGNPASPLAFVGEAPGEEEDAQGQPFVGSSGILLDKMIDAMRRYAGADLGIPFPDEPYVCNAVKCRPPRNKLLKDGSDVAACSDWLWQQLRLLPNLRVIVALGKVASIALLGATENSTPPKRDMTMKWLREHAHAEPVGAIPHGLKAYTSVRFWPTYHPSYLLRQPNRKDLRAASWKDLKRATEALR